MYKVVGLVFIFHCILLPLQAQEPIGFATLFTVKQTGNADKPFTYQLNPKALSFIQTYMDKEGPGLKKMKTWAKPYFNLYDQILIANNVPVELKYLSVIESSLNAGVVSWAGAVGPWQIMPEEAKRLGLKLFPIDERTDYEKSTKAAAVILRELYKEFEDWLLVVAAYNGGAGRVRQAIKKKGTKNFWLLQYELPLETRNHVKKFIATQYVFEAGDNEIQVSDPLANNPKLQKEVVTDLVHTTISGRFTYATIALFLNMEEALLRKYNPEMEKTVASGKTYELNLPAGMMEKFKARKNEILQASIQSLYKID